MKEAFKIAGILILVLLILVAFLFATGVIELKFLEYFGIRRANVEREIFLESQSQVQGAIRDLANYRREYNQTDDEQEKNAIAQLIVNRLSHVELDQIPDQELRIFLQDIRAGRL